MIYLVKRLRMTVSQLCVAEHAPSGLGKYDFKTLDAFKNLYIKELLSKGATNV